MNHGDTEAQRANLRSVRIDIAQDKLYAISIEVRSPDLAELPGLVTLARAHAWKMYGGPSFNQMPESEGQG